MADPVDGFLEELGEVTDQVLVAGLARPAADLDDALEALAERADRLGVASAAAEVRALGATLRDPDAAWAATQRLLSWRQLFTRALSLERVERRMAEAAETEPRAARIRAQGFTGRIYCHGFSLDELGRMSLYGTDIDGGALVQLRDKLSEQDEDDPLARPVISRLFQASVDLRRVLGSLVVFEDHPFVTRRGRVELAPAFRDVPVLHALAPAFVPPDVERDEARLDVEGGWRLADGTPVVESDALRLNLTKLAMVDREVRTPVAVRVSGEDHHVLHATDAADERVFPTHDPALFGLTTAWLQERAQDHADPRLRAACAALACARPFERDLVVQTTGDVAADDVCNRALQIRLDDPEAAVEFLEAHLAAWRRPDTPLPTPTEMLRLGETLSRIIADGADPTAVAALRLPRLRVAQACASALRHWDGEAAAALLCAASAGVLGWLVA